MLKNGNLTLLGEIRGLKPQRLTSDPVAEDLKVGLVWVNTTDKALRWYDGEEVLTVASGGNLDNYLSLDGGTLTGPLILSGPGTEDLNPASFKQLTDGLGAKQDEITGAASTVATLDLAPSVVVVSDADGKITGSATVNVEELGYLDGVTSAIQGQIDGKQAELGFTPLNKAGDAINGNLNFGGTNTAKNLAAPVDPTDPVRLIDIDNLKADLDFQADVLATQVDASTIPDLSNTLPDSAVRYIITDADALDSGFGTIAGLEDGDIVQKDGATFKVVYDVSERGPGVLVWDRNAVKFMKFNGTNWSEHGGLSGVTVSAGLLKEGNTISVKFGAGVTNLPDGEVGIDVGTTGGLALVDPTSGAASTEEDAVLALKLKASSGLAVSADGVSIADEGVTARTIAAAALGNGLQGGAGTALSVKLDGATLSLGAAGLKVGDLSDTYLSLAEGGAVTGDVTVPAPAGDNSIANRKSVTDITGPLADRIDTLEAGAGASQVVFDGTTGAAQDTYSINHGLNYRWATVAVYDETFTQILPDNVTLTDANNLVVTLAVAQKVYIVINGKKVAA